VKGRVGNVKERGERTNPFIINNQRVSTTLGNTVET
jgi:hypothetical protein